MNGFNEWLYHNEGERYEGLREEFFEGGGEPGNFLDWAEDKYTAEQKKKVASKADSPPTKWPSTGMLVGVDAFNTALYQYRDAAGELATARIQAEQVKGGDYDQDVRERVCTFLVLCEQRFAEAAQLLAEQVDAAVATADTRNCD
ncbi:hypothetical protein [Pseudomonas sp. NPDC096950]|uniref:hypothetical protein n=1 Tax=Pseudomonas sp. NPDC096950 TaxID=3364485 RepID=UPI00383A25FE